MVSLPLGNLVLMIILSSCLKLKRKKKIQGFLSMGLQYFVHTWIKVLLHGELCKAICQMARCFSFPRKLFAITEVVTYDVQN